MPDTIPSKRNISEARQIEHLLADVSELVVTQEKHLRPEPHMYAHTLDGHERRGIATNIHVLQAW